MDLSDKYGDYGIIAAALVLDDTIDSFLLSCRAFGRKAEDALLISILQEMKDAGMKTVKALFVATEKNSMTRDFYERLGFTKENEDASRTTWVYDLTGKLPEMPGWIRPD